MNTKSIVIGGVGGQGTILASEIISDALFKAGFDVKKSEIHGMSQRGGSVVSFIRYGDEVGSPIVGMGSADVLLAFEKLEALRYLNYLKQDGMALISDTSIDPVPVVLGNMEYPENIEATVQQRTFNTRVIDAVPTAKEAGNLKAANVVMIGLLSNHIPEVEDSVWEASIKNMVKPKFVDVNLVAFQKGKELT